MFELLSGYESWGDLEFNGDYNWLYPNAKSYITIVTENYLFITFSLQNRTPIPNEDLDRWFLSYGNPYTKRIHHPKGWISIPGGRIQIQETCDSSVQRIKCYPTYVVAFEGDEEAVRRFIENNVEYLFTYETDHFVGPIEELGVYTEEEGY